MRWALVDFQTDCPAGTMITPAKVIPGAGVSRGRLLGKETAKAIEIDTGIMQVSISRKSFRLFDRVVVEGKELVKPSERNGIFCVGGDAREYTSGNDGEVKWY